MTYRWLAAPALAISLVAASIGGCGDSGDKPEGIESTSIVSDARAPSKSEITDADIGRTAPATASRAFTEFWSSLQWQDWPAAVNRYSPGLRRAVGWQRILAAVKYQGSLYRVAKPALERESTRNGLTTVRYSYVDQVGARNLNTTIWRQENGRWMLVFDGLLDSGLQASAQARVQAKTGTDSATPTKEALAAGARASALQGRFLESLRDRATAAGAS